jgi:hypothetical protein
MSERLLLKRNVHAPRDEARIEHGRTYLLRTAVKCAEGRTKVGVVVASYVSKEGDLVVEIETRGGPKAKEAPGD